MGKNRLQAAVGIVNLIITGDYDTDLRLLYFCKTNFTTLFVSLSDFKMPQDPISSVRKKIKKHRSDWMQKGLRDIVENESLLTILRETAIKGGRDFSSYAGIKALMLFEISLFRLKLCDIPFMGSDYLFKVSYMHLGKAEYFSFFS